MVCCGCKARVSWHGSIQEVCASLRLLWCEGDPSAWHEDVALLAGLGA